MEIREGREGEVVEEETRGEMGEMPQAAERRDNCHMQS